MQKKLLNNEDDH